MERRGRHFCWDAWNTQRKGSCSDGEPIVEADTVVLMWNTLIWTWGHPFLDLDESSEEHENSDKPQESSERTQLQYIRMSSCLNLKIAQKSTRRPQANTNRLWINPRRSQIKSTYMPLKHQDVEIFDFDEMSDDDDETPGISRISERFHSVQDMEEISCSSKHSVHHETSLPESEEAVKRLTSLLNPARRRRRRKESKPSSKDCGKLCYATQNFIFLLWAPLHVWN